MGRGVSYPTRATKVCYVDLNDYDEPECCCDNEDCDNPKCGAVPWDWQWEGFKESVKYAIKEAFPSFDDCDMWIDREDYAILENGHAYIVVSCYCGLASVSLLDRYQYDDVYDYDAHRTYLSQAWCRKVADRFASVINDRFGGLRKLGTASNGESFYERV